MQRLKKPTRPGRVRLALSAGAFSMGLLGLARLAGAQAVLDPGTVQGTWNLLPNWNFCPTPSSDGTCSGQSYNYENVSSNDGFNASSNHGGNTYSMVSEGGHDYQYFSGCAYLYQPTFTEFCVNLQSYPLFTLPVGGTVTEDMQRPGATAVLNVSSITGPGQVAYVYGSSNTNLSNGNTYEYDSTYLSSVSGSTANLPIVAGSNVNVYMYASINILDSNGNVLCNVSQSWNDTLATVNAGDTQQINHDVTVDPSQCPTDFRLTGTVNTLFPDGALGYYGYIAAYGNNYFSTSITPAVGPVTYAITQDGTATGTPIMPAGNYTTYLIEYINQPIGCASSGNCVGYSYFYDYDGYNQITLGPSDATRDWLYINPDDNGNDSRGATVNTMFNITGIWQDRWQQKSVSIYPSYCDATGTICPQPAYGTGAASYVNLPAQNPDAPPVTIETRPGDYYMGSAYVQFYDGLSATPVQNYNYLPVNQQISVPPGGTVSAQPLSSDTSEGLILFHVNVPSGQPGVPISSPTIYAYGTTNNTTVYSYGYTSGNLSPQVKVVGPPDTYNITAYANVLGSYAKFATGTLTLGGSVNTPTGLQVDIQPTSSTGTALPLHLTFSEVVSGGQTTVSTTTVGSPPQGYTVLNAINGDPYMDVNTSATISGKVELVLNYDPYLLKLTPSQESRLAFMHYVCTVNSGSYCDAATACPSSQTCQQNQCYNCAWQKINEVANPHNPPYTSADPTYYGTHDSDNPAFTNPNTTNITYSGGIYHRLYGVTQGFSLFAIALPDDTTDTTPPVITCSPQTVECTGPTTSVQGVATCTDDSGSCTVSCNTGSFALGQQSVTCTAKDPSGNTSTCTDTITIQDTTPPNISVSVSPTSIWPPNKKMVPISVSKTVSDKCDPSPTAYCTATSSEPLKGNPDIAIDSSDNISVRADRLGTGNGRIYTISCTAKDASGNTSAAATGTVTVPHDQGH